MTEGNSLRPSPGGGPQPPHPRPSTHPRSALASEDSTWGVLPGGVQGGFHRRSLGDREGLEGNRRNGKQKGDPARPRPRPRREGPHRVADWDLLLSTERQQQNHRSSRQGRPPRSTPAARTAKATFSSSAPPAPSSLAPLLKMGGVVVVSSYFYFILFFPGLHHTSFHHKELLILQGGR